MNGKRNPQSLHSRIEAIVLDTGECSLDHLVAVLGPTIPASEAVHLTRATRKYHQKERAQKGHRYRGNHSVERLAEMGRRRKVMIAANSLIDTGRIRRVKLGVYGPPLPKILRFDSSQSAG